MFVWQSSHIALLPQTSAMGMKTWPFRSVKPSSCVWQWWPMLLNHSEGANLFSCFAQTQKRHKSCIWLGKARLANGGREYRNASQAWGFSMRPSLCLLIPFLGHQLQILPAAALSWMAAWAAEHELYFQVGITLCPAGFCWQRELEGEKQAAGKNRKIQREESKLLKQKG